jgi:hypothetical protein
VDGSGGPRMSAGLTGPVRAFQAGARPRGRPQWVTLLTCQVAKAKRIGSAAAKCSNQADLHPTFIDPI